MEAVILAGGLGTRLKPVVSDRPKPMAQVKGRPFLEYLLDYWIGQGIGRFVLSVGYLSESIRGHFGSSYRGVSIAYAVEDRPLGTGGGLMLSMDALEGSGPVLVANGDTYFPIPLSSFFEFHREKRSEVTMALREVEKADRYGTVALGKESRVSSFLAAGTGLKEGVSLINGGVYLFEREWLLRSCRKWPGDEPVSLERDLFEGALFDKIPFYGLNFREMFIDIGIPADYERCQTLF